MYILLQPSDLENEMLLKAARLVISGRVLVSKAAELYRFTENQIASCIEWGSLEPMTEWEIAEAEKVYVISIF